MKQMIFRNLPGVDDLELRLQNLHRLMLDERRELRDDIDQVSLQLFGIKLYETISYPAEVGEALSTEKQAEWDQHFVFLDEEYEEENAFWEAIGLDMTDQDGEPLSCLVHFGRQIVCAAKGIHPKARFRFRGDIPASDSQAEADAEAWGRRFLLP